jgi:protein-disulfide isomerase
VAEEKKKNLSKLATPVLGGLLLVAAFMIGSLFTQVKSLQKKEGGAPTEVPTETGIGQEGPAGVLSAENQARIADSENSRGETGAKVTIVEFSEYQCPFCKRYIEAAYAQIWEEYEGKIRYVFRDYPLPFHQHAQKASEAARCAADQDGFWEYHDLLFENQSVWSSKTEIDQDLVAFATELSLNKSQFESCLTSGEHAQTVKDDLALGQELGVSGTPTFFINGRMLVGAQPFEAFKEIIDEELGK